MLAAYEQLTREAHFLDTGEGEGVCKAALSAARVGRVLPAQILGKAVMLRLV